MPVHKDIRKRVHSWAQLSYSVLVHMKIYQFSKKNEAFATLIFFIS